MSLRRTLRSSVAAVCIGGLAAPAGAVPHVIHVTARPSLEVRVAQARDFSRVEFRGMGGAVRRDGQTVVVSFPRDADPDISRLRTSPPRWLKTAEARHAHGRLELVLVLDDGADAKFGAADGATYVNVFEAAQPQTPAQAAQAAAAKAPSEPAPTRADPVPAGGVVRMDAHLANGQAVLNFPWANPNGAAVFRRGAAIWVVFDTPATIDVSKAPRGLRQYSSLQAFRGADYSAVRIDGAAGTPVFAASAGAVWTVTLGPGGQNQASLVRLSRDEDGGSAALKAPVAGVTRIVHVADPFAGDVLSVATALGPAKGLPSRREFVQMAFLPSAQGLAVESYIDDLAMSHDGDIVHVARDAGHAQGRRRRTTTRGDAGFD
jgi:hypothetical protein